MRYAQTYFLNTGPSRTLIEIASQIFPKDKPKTMDYHVNLCRESTGFPILECFTPEHRLYYKVSGGLKVMDHDSAYKWSGKSFTIELGDIETDRLREIVLRLISEKNIKI